MTDIDVVVVAYNSRDHLRGCVEPLTHMAGVRVIVVDNASPGADLETVADLQLTAVRNDRNGGFGYGCNAGWRAGDAPFVLFLNPDARIDEHSIRALAAVLEADGRVALAGPRLVRDDGSLILSQRRFPHPATTFARALFLNRLLPNAAWTSEPMPDDGRYARPGRPDWISGACMLVRRPVLERVGGFDDGFFLYCEEKDLARRIRDAGHEIAYEPAALCSHAEGGSEQSPRLYGVLAASRVRYARKHGGALAGVLERIGLGLLALTRIAVTREPLTRAGHTATLMTAAGRPPVLP